MAHSNIPPQQAIKAFLAPTTRHIRRVEIYEQDTITRWAKDTSVRLKGGSVSVDYSRDERRTLDLTLDNSDAVLLNAPGEFWYDKIIKVFRGVEIPNSERLPSILVISDRQRPDEVAESFRRTMVGANLGDVQVNVLANTWEEFSRFDIIVGLSGATANQIALMTQAYRAGKSVLLLGTDSPPWIEGTFTTEVATTVGVVDPLGVYRGYLKGYAKAGEITSPGTAGSIVPVSPTPHPVAQGWSVFNLRQTGTTKAYVVTGDNYTLIAPVGTAGITPTTPARIATFEDSSSGGRAVVLSALINYQQFEEKEFNNFLASAVRWLNRVEAITFWETQIGEFMVDRISEPNFPHEFRITGRDYAKKCMNSKFANATQFESGYTLESLIAAIASNAGITKRELPLTGRVVGKKFFFERGVTRWEAMKEIANAYNYEIYFDSQGYLVMREYRDPAFGAPVVYIHTGTNGQIATYEKSTSDSRIYNHVVVTGESSDSSTPPVYAEAFNDDPRSPTRRSEIGDRLFQYTSAFITTTAQARDVANNMIAIHALEEFELNFDSLMLPWLEVGEVIGWIDPSPAPGDPTTFLLGSLTFTLGLGPMSGIARRITKVN